MAGTIVALCFCSFFESFAVLFRCRWAGGGGWGDGGDKNVILLCPCPKRQYLLCFCLFVQHTAQRMWNKTRCHKRPCLSRPCPRHWYLQCLGVLVQHTAQGCGTRKAVARTKALAAAQTLVFTSFLFLYVLRAEDSALTHSVSETEAQCNKE